MNFDGLYFHDLYVYGKRNFFVSDYLRNSKISNVHVYNINTEAADSIFLQNW